MKEALHATVTHARPPHEPLVRSSGFGRFGPPEDGTPNPMDIAGSRFMVPTRLINGVGAFHEPDFLGLRLLGTLALLCLASFDLAARDADTPPASLRDRIQARI